MGEQYTLAEINYSPFLARVDALAMLDLFFKQYPLATEWWERCRARTSFKAAEVGPAVGATAELYQECGTRGRAELLALIGRIETTDLYDLAG